MCQSVLKLDSTLFDVCRGFDEPALGDGALVLGKVAEEPLSGSRRSRNADQAASKP